jgi:hypothetical protein
MKDYFWVLYDPDTELPISVCSAYFGMSDRPLGENWVLVKIVPNSECLVKWPEQKDKV